jgi:excisionase family DNA binding protein
MPQTAIVIEAPRRLHSITQVCELTGLGRDIILAAIYGGHLRACRVGTRRFVSNEALAQWIAALPSVVDLPCAKQQGGDAQ